MNNPVEIEFAANLETPPGTPKIFSFLQIRPIVHTEETININLLTLHYEIIIMNFTLQNTLFTC